VPAIHRRNHCSLAISTGVLQHNRPGTDVDDQFRSDMYVSWPKEDILPRETALFDPLDDEPVLSQHSH
jgi:hypothetical protein